MMYYLDGRWRRQSLVYFGEPQDHPRMSPWGGVDSRRVSSPAATVEYLVSANDYDEL